MTNLDGRIPTRERLLDRAELLFAEQGYHAVTVRAVTNAAEANLAAVNYHFGTKANLYQEVFRSRWAVRARKVKRCFYDLLENQSVDTKEAIVDSLARSFFSGPLSEKERRCFFLLMMREITRPTDTFRLISDEFITPFLREIMDIFKPCLSHIKSEDKLALSILSIFALMLSFNFARRPAARLAGQHDDEAFQGQVLQHIIAFSLNGLDTAPGRLMV